MSQTIIFAFGLFVTAITGVAVILTGLNEASDPTQSRPEDVADWEASLIERDPAAEITERTDNR